MTLCSTNKYIYIFFLNIKSLILKLYQCKLGGWQMGGFCKEVKVAQVGFVTNKATQSSVKKVAILKCSYMI